MIGTTLRTAWAHKRRLLSTAAAVVLGVAFLAATLVLGDSARAGFDDTFTSANAGTDVVVRGTGAISSEDVTQRRPVDEALVAAVAAVDGVEAAVPDVTGSGQIVGADGTPLGGGGPPTIAGSWQDDARFSAFTVVEGRAPARTGEVVIDRGSAREGDLGVGDVTTLLTPAPFEVEVVGIVAFGDRDQLAGATYAGLTLDDAQARLLGSDTALTSVLAAGGPSVDQDALAAAVRAGLPGDVEVLTGEALVAEQRQQVEDAFLGFFTTFLDVFAVIALLVATFSIHNTFSILVAQRQRESALLRAIGASRRQVLVGTLVEATLVGVAASAAGAIVGIGFARGLQALFGAGGFDLPADELVVTSGSLGVAVTAGIVATLAAALAPAVRGSGVPPLAAMREVAVDRTGTSRRRLLVGGPATVLGAVLVVVGAAEGIGIALLGSLLTLAGVVAIGPVVARPTAWALGAPVAAARGLSGRLARRNAMRNPRRTSATASALLVGVAVVTVFTVLAASIKESVDVVVRQSFGGDLVVEPQSFSGAGLDPALRAELASLPEVGTVAGLALGPMRLDGEDQEAIVTDPVALDGVLDIGVEEGSLAGAGALGERGVLVSAELAAANGWALGDTVPAEFADGAVVDLEVGAIYRETDLLGDLVLPSAAWAPHATNVAGDIVVLVELADGVALGAGRSAIEAVTAGYGSPAVRDREQYIESVASEVDAFLAVIYVLLVLAIVIALMGIANTLSLSVHERRTELGLLRAVGQDRAQVRAMVRWEAVLVAVFGTLGGIGLGTFLGYGLVLAVADEGFGAVAIPAGQLGVVVALGALVGVVAGARPARRAARLPILDALAA